MTTQSNAESFVLVLKRSGLVEPNRLARVLREIQAEGVPLPDAKSLAEQLVARSAITRWQADRLLAGKHKNFVLGKYRLLSLLGRGGMSSVYLAEHIVMRRRCAIKVLPNKRIDDSSYLARFHREAQAVASLDHPNIVRAYDVDKQRDGTNEVHFLVMEYVDGASLQEMVHRQGPLAFADAAEYVRQAALGLSHAHAAGMVHRDIKPGNLLVDQNGTVKILDLGLARFFGHDEEGQDPLTIRHDEKVLGTADYLAPEQALDSHAVDARADVYGLGCTFYYLLCGHPPFTEGTLAQRLMAHQTKEPHPLERERPDLPASLLVVVRKMMAKRPEDRYQTANEVGESLLQWLRKNATDEWKRTHAAYQSAERPNETGPHARRTAVPVAKPVVAPPVAAPPVSSKQPTVQAPTPPAPRVVEEDSRQPGGGVMFQEPLAPPSDEPPVAVPAVAHDAQEPELAAFFHQLAPEPVEAPSDEPRERFAVVEAIPAVPVAKSPAAETRAQPKVAKPVAAATPVIAAKPVQPVTVPEPQFVEVAPIFEPQSGSDVLDFAGFQSLDDTSGSGSTPRSTGRRSSIKTKQSAVRLPAVNGRSVPIRWIAAGTAALILLVVGTVWLFRGRPPAPSVTKSPEKVTPAQKAETQPLSAPREWDQREISVGPKEKYQTIAAALNDARKYFVPHGRHDALTIHVAGGTYGERLMLENPKHSGENAWPQRIHVIAAPGERPVLKPDGPEPILRLNGIEEFQLRGFDLDAAGKADAVVLAGSLTGTQLSDLTIRGFQKTGVRIEGAMGVSAGMGYATELVLDGLTLRPGDASATGVAVRKGEPDPAHLVISHGRFLGPMATGILFAAPAVNGCAVTGTIFAETKVAIRFQGANVWKDVTFINNTFYKAGRGIVFTELPDPKSTGLAFQRNLFAGLTGPEAVVEQDYKLRNFQSALSSNGAPIDLNWTDRDAKAGANEIDLFSANGRRGSIDFEFLSTDSADPKFLAPSPSSPEAKAPAPRSGHGKPYLGAVAPPPPAKTAKKSK